MMLAKQTEIDECSDRFVVTHQEDVISTLADLNDLEEYARLNIRVKVFDCSKPTKNLYWKGNPKCGGSR